MSLHRTDAALNHARLLSGRSTLLVGVEDNGDGGLRLYLGHRSMGLYALVYDAETQEQIQAAWADRRGHIAIPTPSADETYRETT